ncbi:halocyanin domain-containing protein [Halorubrum lipolyticum]|uniref:Halocyanin n=1 Tax=Halorubrum lipolyticum DSM 21995 TaxID=1227482 RepID=M0P716_9EURY|nr:halocyanin domain-containing protein [Halorubrum lipolyticum]EMA64630.1 halocyanin [Halorubrum lipolyticum DSM 21995]
MADTHSRRAFLATTGTTASLALAGCSDATNDSESTTPSDEPTEDSGDGEDREDGGDGEDGGDSGDNVSDDDTSTNTSNTTNTETETEKSWIENANNYSGIEDRTGESSVLIEVGAGDAGLSFDPPAIRVSSGTTISWKWVGDNVHKVVAEDGSFESSTDGLTYSRTFAEPKEVRYVCAPHQGVGMIGLIIVESG